MKASVADQRKLLELQSLDITTSALNAKATSLPEIAAIQSATLKLNLARDLRVAAETELSDIKSELTRAENDVEQITTRISRDESRLASGTGTPKELEQLQHELGSLAKRKADLEDVELEVMMRVDGIKARIDEKKSEETSLTEEITQLEVSKENQLTVILKDLEETKAARAKLATEIDGELVKLYEKIREGGGLGAAPLVGNQCKSCNLVINAIELAKLHSLAEDEVARCEDCRAILVRL